MKNLALIFAALISFSSFAEDAKQSPEMVKMRENMKLYSTPGDVHKVLATAVGKWKYKSTWQMDAASKPEISTGTATMKMILNGRFLQQTMKGTAMGKPFEGMGIVGYDTLKGETESLWMDNMGTGVVHGTGNFDATAKSFNDEGTYSCPMTADKTQKFRAEWKLVDKGNMTYTMWTVGTDGKEFKQMEIAYTR